MKQKRNRASIPLAMSVTAGLAGCHPSARVGAAQAADRPAVTSQQRPNATPLIASRPSAALDERSKSEALLALLRSQAVDRSDFARRTLYTWTTAEQAAELRRGGPLLVRETSPTRGVSLYDVALEAQARSGQAIARTLREPRFRKARFAWSNPWATLLGWEGETYGDQLIAVTLRADAWIVRFTCRFGEFSAVDVEGRTVALDDVLAHPERVGAVHYINDVAGARGTFVAPVFHGHGTYREFVLPNEPMIERWELGTEAVNAAVRRSIETMAAMSERLAYLDLVAPPRAWAPTRWDDASDGDDLFAAWDRALAFENSRYAPTVENARAILAALRALPRAAEYLGTPEQARELARRRQAAPAARPRPSSSPAPRTLYGTYVGTFHR